VRTILSIIVVLILIWLLFVIVGRVL